MAIETEGNVIHLLRAGSGKILQYRKLPEDFFLSFCLKLRSVDIRFGGFFGSGAVVRTWRAVGGWKNFSSKSQSSVKIAVLQGKHSLFGRAVVNPESEVVLARWTGSLG
ncbi:uncharacterized protein K444DRAFT_388726 [Hyaloscypha bicolor E]|uniref:Uncharacterized protein n=1 Tax=Hyaloscypha bicolor E TaxID=1095630 RepID=A0A2J6TCM0_9HELO|nr:uncharacterized protein K444DRAFT_388726 [Hyaloscypha bicolor E]PMD60775.1 hypothetical protein K444DRAFT_388726 [Hyaloscypha bicolor E]